LLELDLFDEAEPGFELDEDACTPCELEPDDLLDEDDGEA
jgi:hypothetical protein